MLQYDCAVVRAVAESPGGRSVARILVADDNSNIQKMVGLALKDHGIEVVAVGNGEAAVRKISDLRPDLVLADVFMPVRNGYEVCKYVKDDSSLAHIPVILLVGAFDPLDEQEAQRVGADGVLKKAFVPPPNPELADRDWNAGEEEAEEEEEEDSASSSWRRDGGGEELAADPAVENAAEKAAARNKRRESWTPTREKTQDLLEEAAAPESFISAPPPAPVFSEVAPPQ